MPDTERKRPDDGGADATESSLSLERPAADSGVDDSDDEPALRDVDDDDADDEENE